MKLIRKGLTERSWQITVLSLKPHFQFYSRGSERKKFKVQTKVVSAAVRSYGIFINDWMWETQLRGYTSRAGLFAHEALRLAQLEGVELTDESIEKIVGLLMLRNPCKVSELDEFLYEVRNRIHNKRLRDDISVFPVERQFFDNFTVDNPGLSRGDHDYVSKILEKAVTIMDCRRFSMANRGQDCPWSSEDVLFYLTPRIN